MATEGLTPEGLRRYRRWLAVQRAKGIVPSESDKSAFLSGNIEAELGQQVQMRSLSIAEERNRNATEIARLNAINAARRTDLLEDYYESEQDAAKIAGIGEIVKIGAGVNELTGGLISDTIGAGVSALSDVFTPDVAAPVATEAASAIGGVVTPSPGQTFGGITGEVSEGAGGFVEGVGEVVDDIVETGKNIFQTVVGKA